MRKLTAAAIALSALVLAACGTGGPSAKDSPRDAVDEALDRLSEADGLTLTFSVASTTEDLVTVAEGDVTEEQANWILDSSLTIAANRAEDPEDAQAQISADVADIDDAVQVNVVANTLYFRADVQGMVDLFGADASELDAMEQQAASQGLDWVGPALDGEWLALDLEQVQQATGTSQQLSEQQQKVLDRFVAAFRDSSELSFEGEDDIGEHVVATIPLRDAYQNFAELGQELGGAPVPPPTEVPDDSATLDMWLDGGNLVQVQLDFLQFAEMTDEPVPEGVDELGMRLEIDDGEIDVEEPADATEVTLQEIGQFFFGGMGAEGM